MSTADNRKTKPVFNLEDYQFIDTSFSKLMQRRIRKVLLICSSYDAFMLEEDGRIDEQIFNEYASLNLRYPPIFIHAESYKRALEILDSGEIDLVIEMLSTGDVDPFQLAKQIKNEHPDTPIVVLTHFSREVSLRLENEDLSAIDYVFSWLGNADLLLAIIKLIEDKMNAEHDIQHVGVQAILLIEDSIRYTSTYLPNLYKIIFVQSLEFMKEGLNEHQKMLRMRGRPKILLATNFDEALALYRKYRDNLLGVISDVSYKKSPNRRDTKTKAGLGLTRIIKKDNIHLPVLLQSSDVSNEKYAQHLGAGFLHKYSKNLSIDLREYIKTYFLFGDFIFRNPKTMEEYAVASDLQSLQQIIHTLPDDVFLYHTSRNDLTKWLNSRALFPLANMFRDLRVDDFDNLSDARDYIHRAIATFRTYKGRGVIAQFDPERYDEYMAFTRIGDGSIGGKARGLAFINTLIKKYNLHNRFPQARVSIPKTIVISTDVFEEFMESNALYDVALSQARDEEILQAFVKAKLPDSLRIDLARIISVINKPIAVRSSSKLEDSHFQPFAGIYSTYMVPINPLDPDQSVSYLEEAIKSVYASVYYKSSKAYMMVTSNVIDEEKMGIVLQEICGKQVGNYFYPTISGVARSVNFYPIHPEKSSDGTATIAYGLGKFIVEGGLALRFSPKFPRKVLQLSSPEMALRNTQKHFYALNLEPKAFTPSVDDAINLKKMRITEGKHDKTFNHITSTFDFQNHILRDGVGQEGKPVITFSNLLNHNTFPLAEILDEILHVGQKEMNNPIEIEFAVDLEEELNSINTFSFLQIRPVVQNENSFSFKLDRVPPEKTIIYSEKALGNGSFTNLKDVVYVRPESFNAAHNPRLVEMIEQINQEFMEMKKYFILIGPGRWGSSDPWLGIPVRWPQISNARIIVETGLKNYRIDPSQGTHFFQNLTSFGVGYLTVNPSENDGYFDVEYLNGFPAVFENEHLRHVRFEKNIKVQIDGKQNIGLIHKSN